MVLYASLAKAAEQSVKTISAARSGLSRMAILLPLSRNVFQWFRPPFFPPLPDILGIDHRVVVARLRHHEENRFRHTDESTVKGHAQPLEGTDNVSNFAPV